MDKDFVMLQEENARLKQELVDARNSNASLRAQIKPIMILEKEAYEWKKQSESWQNGFIVMSIMAAGVSLFGALGIEFGWF